MRTLSRLAPAVVVALVVSAYLRARRTSLTAAPGSGAPDLNTGPG